jgi:hypothetical protein
MTDFIAGNTAVDNARSLAQSALPNAPQEPHEPAKRRTATVRARVTAILRTGIDSVIPAPSKPRTESPRHPAPSPAR